MQRVGGECIDSVRIADYSGTIDCISSMTTENTLDLTPHRFKLNRDLAAMDIYYLTTSRAELVVDEADRPIYFNFPNPDTMRFPGALISASNISFTYQNTKKLPADTTPNYTLLNVSLTIHPGSRTALVGRNGEGKSTLVSVSFLR